MFIDRDPRKQIRENLKYRKEDQQEAVKGGGGGGGGGSNSGKKSGNAGGQKSASGQYQGTHNRKQTAVRVALKKFKDSRTPRPPKA